MDMAVMATDVSMVDTDTARGRLRLLLMLSPAMDTDMAVDMDMAVMDVSMEDTDTARGLLRLMLRLMLSPDMDTTAVDMVVTDTDVSMVDTADTMDKSKSNQSSFLHSNIHSCSKIESCFTSKFPEIKVSKSKK